MSVHRPAPRTPSGFPCITLLFAAAAAVTACGGGAERTVDPEAEWRAAITAAAEKTLEQRSFRTSLRGRGAPLVAGRSFAAPRQGRVEGYFSSSTSQAAVNLEVDFFAERQHTIGRYSAGLQGDEERILGDTWLEIQREPVTDLLTNPLRVLGALDEAVVDVESAEAQEGGWGEIFREPVTRFNGKFDLRAAARADGPLSRGLKRHFRRMKRTAVPVQIVVDEEGLVREIDVAVGDVEKRNSLDMALDLDRFGNKRDLGRAPDDFISLKEQRELRKGIRPKVPLPGLRT